MRRFVTMFLVVIRYFRTSIVNQIYATSSRNVFNRNGNIFTSQYRMRYGEVAPLNPCLRRTKTINTRLVSGFSLETNLYFNSRDGTRRIFFTYEPVDGFII